MSLSQTGTFVETLIDLVDGATRANIIGFSSNNKLVLNGAGGPDGGSGIPWGGLVGQLIQRRVCYDTTEAATPCILPSSSLLDNLNHIRWHHQPATWFEMSPTDPRSMRVNIASGIWYKDEADRVEFTGGTSPIITSPTIDPRIDVVYLTVSGVVAVSEGVEAASPIFTIPSGTILPIGAVYVTPVACGIGWPCDASLYSGSLYSGYIHKDLRPFITYPGGGGGAPGLWTDYGGYIEPTDPRDVRIGTGQKLYPEDAAGQDLGDATHLWDVFASYVDLPNAGWIGNSVITSSLVFDSAGAGLAYFPQSLVGIATPLPTRQLEIHVTNNSVVWNNAITQEALFIRNPWDSDNNWAFITFGGAGGIPATWIGTQFIDSGNDFGTLSFGTRGAGGHAQRMRIESGGDTRISTTQKLYPEDAAGQDLGDATHLWDVFASYVDLPDTGWIGNAVADMRIEFHAANYIKIGTDGPNVYFIDENASWSTPMTATAANINITGGDGIAGDDAGIWLRNEETNVDWSIFVDESDSDHLKIARENTEIAEFDTTGNFRMFTGNDIDPEDATGQDLGNSTHRWDLYANDINMDNGGVIHCTTLGGPVITFDSISDYLEITECRVSIGHGVPVVALDINTPTFNHNGILLGSGGPPANLGMIKFTGLDFFGFTTSGWLSLTASGTGGGGGASLWTDYGAYIEPSSPNDVRIGTSQDLYPEDATGQDLGRGGNRWDIYARRINMSDAGWIGILNNETLTFNAGGNVTFSVEVGSVIVNDGTWIGADAACSWVFDSGNGDVTTLDKVGVGTAVPRNVLNTAISSAGVVEGALAHQGLYIENTDPTDNNWIGIMFAGVEDAPGLAQRSFAGIEVQMLDHTAGILDSEMVFLTRIAGVYGECVYVSGTGVGIKAAATETLTVHNSTDNSATDPSDYAGGVFIRNQDVTAGAYAALGLGFSRAGDSWYIKSIRNANEDIDLAFTRDYSTAGVLEAMRIDKDGNVGIGTATPGSYHANANNLVVYENGAAGITIASATNNAGSIFFADGTVGDAAYRGSIVYDHVADEMVFRTAGVDDRMVIDSSGYVGIGAPTPPSLLTVYDTTINTAADYTGARFWFYKTAGATDTNDTFYGTYTVVNMNQNLGTVSNMYGGLLYARMTLGNVGSVAVARSLIGQLAVADLDGGKVWGDAYGLQAKVDQEGGPGNEVVGDINGIRITVDVDGTLGGTATMLYLEEQNNVDYGIYQSGTADNYFGGDVGIGEAAPQRLLHVDGRVRIDDGSTAPGTAYAEPTDYYGDGDPVACGNPHAWLRIDIEGNTYKIPCYT